MAAVSVWICAHLAHVAKHLLAYRILPVRTQHVFINCFGFHNRNREAVPDEQPIIRAQAFLAGTLTTQRHNPPGR